MISNYKEVLYDSETLSTKNLILRKFKKEELFEQSVFFRYIYVNANYIVK